MSGHSLVIGVVGKPSVGKSTFFNSVTEGKAKVGNYPFTTIEPNTGISFYRTKCASVSRNKLSECNPKYGKVRKEDGTRFIPIKMLDVAGLVPGASKGLGLGNKFLNDLCGADVLIHIIDASGTTNEKGEATIGYDPLNDADWLVGELNDWIFNNIWEKWSSVSRRHHAAKQTALVTFSASFSGYGGTKGGKLVNTVLEEMELKDPVELNQWTELEVRSLVSCFVRHRFPMILLLNKADPAAYKATKEGALSLDKNISNIVEKYDRVTIKRQQGEGGGGGKGAGGMRCVVGSANAELFLMSCAAKRYIQYKEGDTAFTTLEDDLDDLNFRKSRVTATSNEENDLEKTMKLFQAEEAEIRSRYSPIEDDKIGRRLERLQELMYRFNGTGVWRAVQMAVDLKQPAVAYPVHSLTNFSTGEPMSCFAECHLLKAGTTVGQLGAMLFDAEDSYSYVEGEDGRRLAHDHVLTGVDNVLRYMSQGNQPVPFKSYQTSSAGTGGTTASSKKNNSNKAGNKEEEMVAAPCPTLSPSTDVPMLPTCSDVQLSPDIINKLSSNIKALTYEKQAAED